MSALFAAKTVRPAFGVCLLLFPQLSALQVNAKPVLDVSKFGAVCDGVSDDTAAIRAAAAAVPEAGGTLLFSGGICSVSDVTPLKSGTRVRGQGATIRNYPPAAWPHGVEGAFKMDSVTNVTVEGLRFAWQHGFYNGGAAHILEAINSRNIIIRDNVSEGGGDFAASIGSSDVLMEHNRVSEVDNSCFDSWGGSQRIWVIDNTCETTTREHPGVGAIQFTGINTDGSPAVNVGFYADGNTVIINTPKGQAFEINGSPDGGATADIKITNNKIIIGANAWGVLVTHASHGTVSNNTIDVTASHVLGTLHIDALSPYWTVISNKTRHLPRPP